LTYWVIIFVHCSILKPLRSNPMLQVNNLSVCFRRNNKSFGHHTLSPVSDISLSVHEGEIVALIGASGAGKSLLAHALLGLLPGNATIHGQFIFKGQELTPDDIGTLRGKEIALIPQSVSHLNPLTRAGKQVYRAARLSGCCHCSAGSGRDKAFQRYSLADNIKSMFPFQLSGGMARRVLTATATAGKADLIVADEPTTGLDPEVTRQSLSHLRQLSSSGKGVILITHDLESALQVADTLVIIYDGMTVEIIAAETLKNNRMSLHPYTNALWQALPQNGFSCLPSLKENFGNSRRGCHYIGHCPQANEQCSVLPPHLRHTGISLVRCNHAES
jgi:peptide/nickel transport system ATP-binding protein